MPRGRGTCLAPKADRHQQPGEDGHGRPPSLPLPSIRCAVHRSVPVRERIWSPPAAPRQRATYRSGRPFLWYRSNGMQESHQKCRWVGAAALGRRRSGRRRPSSLPGRLGPESRRRPLFDGVFGDPADGPCLTAGAFLRILPESSSTAIPERARCLPEACRRASSHQLGTGRGQGKTPRWRPSRTGCTNPVFRGRGCVSECRGRHGIVFESSPSVVRWEPFRMRAPRPPPVRKRPGGGTRSGPSWSGVLSIHVEA